VQPSKAKQKPRQTAAHAVTLTTGLSGRPIAWPQQCKRAATEQFIDFINQPVRDHRGAVSGIFVIGNDVTQAQRTLRQLQALTNTLEQQVQQRTAELAAARDAAEAANRAKIAFLATMSHEFRTPLNAVVGFSQLLLQMELPDKALSFVSHVAQAGEQLLGLINDVLDFSRLESGQVVLEQAPFDLAALLDTVHAIIRPQAAAKGLALEFERDGKLPAKLWGDALRLKQVLLSLLVNAVKFTPAGSVRLVVHEVERSAVHVTLRMDVSDTGIGIAPEVQQRIFEPGNWHPRKWADLSKTSFPVRGRGGHYWTPLPRNFNVGGYFYPLNSLRWPPLRKVRRCGLV
jgi:signal transduction histidine kinase